jgi:hypothetical protein
MWKLDVDSIKGSVWTNDDGRFIILVPSGLTKWMVRVGIKDSTSENQEVVYKNRSRAMIKVNSLLQSKSWKYHS